MSETVTGPMEKIQRVVQCMGLADKIEHKTRLRDLVTDSLEMADFILELEAEFGMEIPDEEAEKLFTVGDVLVYAEAH